MADDAKPNPDATQTTDPKTPTPEAGQPTLVSDATKTADPKAGDPKPGDESASSTTKAGDDTAAKPDGAQTPKAPATYTLTLPEGTTVLAAEDLAEIEAEARKADLTNDEAQALVADLHARAEAQSAKYRAVTEADPVYGGTHLEETQRLAALVVAKVRPEGHARRGSFLSFMERGGAGNSIEVLSFLADLGKLMAEDTPVTRTAEGGTAKSTAELLYPSMTKAS